METAPVSRMDSVKAGMKRALIGFLVIDALFVAGAVALYVMVVRPRMVAIEATRDQAVRANVAMTARVRAVEGRLALASGDVSGAAAAAGDVEMQLEGLMARVPRTEARELGELTNLRARAKLVSEELARDPLTARKDLELIDARLAALYPAIGPAIAAKPIDQ